MRSIATLSLFVAAASIGGLASAQKLPTKPIVVPKPVPTVEASKITLPPHIASAKRTGRPGYVSGAINYEVEIVNPTPTPLETNLVVDRLVQTKSVADERGRITRVPVNVPANGRATVPFTDATGIGEVCGTTYNRMSLETGTSTRTLKVVPTCVFGAKTGDPMAGLPPDRRVQQAEGRLGYHTPKLETRQITCSGAKVSATMRNRSTTAARAATIELVGPNNERPPGLSKVDVPPGADREITTYLVPGSGTHFEGQMGRWTLRVEGGGVPTHQPGWYIDVSRLCSLDVDLIETKDIPVRWTPP